MNNQPGEAFSQQGEVKYELTTWLDDASLNWSTIYSISAVNKPTNSSSDNHMRSHNVRLGDIDEYILASIKARIICRNNIRKTFWQSMQRASQTSGEAAFALFDKHGCLQEKLIGGIWTRKMNDACLILIEEVAICAPLNSVLHILVEMVNRLFDHAPDYHETTNAIFIRPRTAFKICSTLQGLDDDIILSLVQMIGYQRVGSTEWFGRSFRPASETVEVAMEVLTPDSSELVEFKKLLELRRTQDRSGPNVIDKSDLFRGHVNALAKRVLTLQGFEQPVTPAQFQQARFGCTCNQCIQGFLSPRMHFTLLKLASKFYNRLHEDMSCDGFRNSLKKDPSLGQKLLVGMVWPHTPASIRPLFLRSKDFALGHAYIFYFIRRLLEAGSPPSLKTLGRDVRDPALDYIDAGCSCCGKKNIGSPQKLISVYLSKGGTIKECIKALFAYAEMRDEKAGDDTFWWPNQMEPGLDFAIEYIALPRCRNDSEFGFVEGMILEN